MRPQSSYGPEGDRRSKWGGVQVDTALIDATLREGIGLDVIHMTQQCQNGLALQTY